MSIPRNLLELMLAANAATLTATPTDKDFERLRGAVAAMGDGASGAGAALTAAARRFLERRKSSGTALRAALTAAARDVGGWGGEQLDLRIGADGGAARPREGGRR